MAIAFNKVILVGRLTRDPEIRSTVSGSTVANFGLAVNRGYKKDNKDEVDFLNIVAFGKLAEFSSNYLSKGRLVLVEGSLRINKWVDRNEVKRESPEIWANTITFLETKKSIQENSFDPSNIKVENGYNNNKNNSNNKKTNNIKSIDDDSLSDDLPEFDNPFSDLESDLSSSDDLL